MILSPLEGVDLSTRPRTLQGGYDYLALTDDGVYHPGLDMNADYTPKELAALILAKAETRRATAKRLAIKDGLIPLDDTHAVQVLDRSTVELATGLSVEAVTVVILEAGFPGHTPEPVRATVLVPTDKPLAAAIKKALAK